MTRQLLKPTFERLTDKCAVTVWTFAQLGQEARTY
jgi:hypothetical protein